MGKVETSGAERRDTLRVPVEMWARPYDHREFIACEGDLSLGGARVRLPAQPRDKAIEVMVNLPAPYGQLRLQGEVIDTFPARSGGVTARVKFGEQLFLDELALARLLDDISGDWEDWSAEHAM